MDEQQSDTLDLRDYLAVLRRRRWIVIQTVIVVVAVAVGVTFLQTPRYESSVRLVVEPANANNDQVLEQLVFGQRELETQKELVSSRPVATRAKELTGVDLEVDQLLERVTVSLIRDTQILEIRATSTSAEQAAMIAGGFGDAYLAYRDEQALQRVVTASQLLQRREDQVTDRLADIDREAATATGSAAEALALEKIRLQNELAGLSASGLSLSANEQLSGGAGQIISPAEVSDSPFSPKPIRTGILAIVLGLLLGVGLAFLRDFLDDAIRSEDQAVQASGVAAVGHIPRWVSGDEHESRLVTLVEPSSPVSESYRTLRTNVRFMAVGRSFGSLLVTSALPGEGKTTTACNLAVALARAGTRVLLVGADLRRPRLHEAFGTDGSPGLSDVLVGEAELTQAILDVGVPNLRVIPAGRVPPNPAELLGAPAMQQLMGELEQISDLVVYDGPPVLAVADALELGPRVGAAMLVVKMGSSGRHAVRAARERLQGVGVPIAGVVLNDLDPSDGYYGYNYYHEYSSETAADTPEKSSTASPSTT